MEDEDDKPFVCSAPACGQKFTNEDHLAVHMRKHEMSLALNMGTGLTPGSGRSPLSGLMPPGLFLDQTPTPTKFLKNCEEIGLFNELKNPFEEAFKKALDTEPQTDTSSAAVLPGPDSNELNTPVPPIPRTVEDLSSDKNKSCETSTKTDLTSLVLNRLKRERVSTGPTSTTVSDDDVVIISSGASKEKISKLVPTVLNIPSQMEAESSVPSSRSFTLVTAAQSTTVSPPRSSEVQAPTISTPPQNTMQVFLQLPNGQTVPVQIPANTPGGFQVVQPSIMTSRVEQAAINTAIQPQTVILPAQTVASAQSQSNLTKQRLKAAIQSQTIPSPVTKHSPQGYTTIQISPGVRQSTPPISLQISPEVTPGIPNISGVEAISPQSFDSIKSELPSPGAADSTVNIKRPRTDDDDGDDRRKKFLERNRAAAARCRQKRKNWITNLEKKGDELQTTNNKLQSEVNSLRAEVAQLKTLLLAHKDCPVTVQQRSQGQLPLSLALTDQVVTATQATSVAHNVTELTGATSTAPKELIESLTSAGLIPGAIVKTVDSGLITTQIVGQPASVPQPTTITLNHPVLTGNNQKIYTIIPKVIKTESPQLKK
ncbi:cyclic AMP-dependent transcription factor ATF-7-like [Saccostrea echinata]|uniref:cyclic AMP-dependent transcription factor ATF-7-like n=1 Tax=Saccostrea echinata TaxID=191078 RepID=UPI002A828648|nr:cyclic AMP-dependent transcription factor ATF-7-like [Saccostrea echinata]